MYAYMLKQGYTKELACTFVRLHLCPKISLRVVDHQALFDRRCNGTLTGSRSAEAAGRLPLIDVCQVRTQEWAGKSFQVDGHSFTLASFVDNLVSTGATTENAIEILEDCEAHLKSRWGLFYGEDSREFLTC